MVADGNADAVRVGVVFTVMVIVCAVPVQVPLEGVTVYVVVTNGVAVTADPVVGVVPPAHT